MLIFFMPFQIYPRRIYNYSILQVKFHHSRLKFVVWKKYEQRVSQRWWPPATRHPSRSMSLSRHLVWFGSFVMWWLGGVLGDSCRFVTLICGRRLVGPEQKKHSAERAERRRWSRTSWRRTAIQRSRRRSTTSPRSTTPPHGVNHGEANRRNEREHDRKGRWSLQWSKQ